MATSALAYGLMGFASGALQGLHDEWQQNQQDIRTAALLKAKMQEEQQLARMKATYDSALNLQKIQAQLTANLQQDSANNAAKSDQQIQKEQADAQQGALDRASREKTAGMSAGASIEAAKIRASADQATGVKPRLVAVKGKDGAISVQAVQPGDSLPAGSQFMNFNGDPQFAPLPVGLLGNLGAPGGSNDSSSASPPSSGSAVTAPAPSVTQPGSSSLNPVDASSLNSAPPLGTWVKLSNGSVKQYRGPGSTNG